MKLKEYKFWYIRRDDNGYITEAAINFCKGEYKDVSTLLDGVERTRNMWVRERKLRDNELKDLNVKILNRLDGTQSVLYIPKDFGKIKTDDELRLFLNEQLDKIKGLNPVDEQKWQH